MQPQQILSLMLFLAIGAHALPALSGGSSPSASTLVNVLANQYVLANSLTIRTDADEDAAYQGTYAGGTEKRAADSLNVRTDAEEDAAYQGTYQGGTE